MKIGIFSESPADEAAIKILVEGILGEKIEIVSSERLRPGGWSHLLQLLPATLKHLHYRTDAEALVVVIDSDDTPVHQRTHDQPGARDSRCRLCQAREILDLEKSRLTPIPGRGPIKMAVGLAVPAIEAWFLCLQDTHVNEAAWARKLESEKITYTKNSLKEALYGTKRPSIEMETAALIDAANRLVADLDMLERLFPEGFGALARDVRSWQV